MNGPFSGVLVLVVVLLLYDDIVPSDLLYSEWLSKLGADCFLPNLQNINIDSASVHALYSDTKENLQSLLNIIRTEFDNVTSSYLG